MKRFLLLILILLPVLMGCWDLSETERLGMVTSMGVDLADSGQIKVIIQEAARESTAGGQAGGGELERSLFHVFSAEGPTIFEAIQGISSKTSYHRPYFAHLRVIVISEELARSKGVKEVIDYLLRNPEVRRRTWVLVARKGQLEKIMATDFGFEMHTGGILEEMFYDRRLNSFLSVTNLRDFSESYEKNQGRELFTSGVYTLEKREVNKALNPSAMISSYDLEVSDTAVFSGNKLAGWLDDKETRGLLWVKGKVKGGILSFSDGGNRISTMILKMNSKIEPVIEGEKIKIKIKVNVVSNIVESKANLDFGKRETIYKVQQLQQKEIKKEIIKAIDKSRKLDSDIFGFGSCIFDQYPWYWSEIAESWYDYYGELDIAVDVKSTINHIGLIEKAGYSPVEYGK